MFIVKECWPFVPVKKFNTSSPIPSITINHLCQEISVSACKPAGCVKVIAGIIRYKVGCSSNKLFTLRYDIRGYMVNLVEYMAKLSYPREKRKYCEKLAKV